MKISIKLTTLFLLTISLTACSSLLKNEDKVPGYKVTIIQGNELSQEQLSQLHIGMTKEEVKELLGSPQLKNPFRDDSWHYVYYVLKSNKFLKKYELVLQFSDNTLANIKGNPEEFNYLNQ